MTTKNGVANQIKDFFEDSEIDWLMEHLCIDLDISTKTMILTVDNMNEQEFFWIHDECIASDIYPAPGSVRIIIK